MMNITLRKECTTVTIIVLLHCIFCTGFKLDDSNSNKVKVEIDTQVMRHPISIKIHNQLYIVVQVGTPPRALKLFLDFNSNDVTLFDDDVLAGSTSYFINNLYGNDNISAFDIFRLGAHHITLPFNINKDYKTELMTTLSINMINIDGTLGLNSNSSLWKYWNSLAIDGDSLMLGTCGIHCKYMDAEVYISKAFTGIHNFHTSIVSSSGKDVYERVALTYNLPYVKHAFGNNTYVTGRFNLSVIDTTISRDLYYRTLLYSHPILDLKGIDGIIIKLHLFSSSISSKKIRDTNKLRGISISSNENSMTVGRYALLNSYCVVYDPRKDDMFLWTRNTPKVSSMTNSYLIFLPVLVCTFLFIVIVQSRMMKHYFWPKNNHHISISKDIVNNNNNIINKDIMIYLPEVIYLVSLYAHIVSIVIFIINVYGLDLQLRLAQFSRSYNNVGISLIWISCIMYNLIGCISVQVMFLRYLNDKPCRPTAWHLHSLLHASILPVWICYIGQLDTFADILGFTVAQVLNVISSSYMFFKRCDHTLTRGMIPVFYYLICCVIDCYILILYTVTPLILTEKSLAFNYNTDSVDDFTLDQLHKVNKNTWSPCRRYLIVNVEKSFQLGYIAFFTFMLGFCVFVYQRIKLICSHINKLKET